MDLVRRELGSSRQSSEEDGTFLLIKLSRSLTPFSFPFFLDRAVHGHGLLNLLGGKQIAI